MANVSDLVEPVPQVPAIVGNRVELQLLTTLRCNLKCSYCSLGVGAVLGSQSEVTYSLDQLDTFIATHLARHEIYVTFYGGEPTLNLELMSAVMRRHPEYRFQLQTNGTLLDDLPDWILARLSNVLVSIDGGEQVTDGYRGRGIYRQVVKNVRAIRSRLGGTLTARVTWSSADTSFEELDELTHYFDYVYFQFVAQDGAYAPDTIAAKRAVLTKMVDKFFSADALYPFIPIMGTVRNKVLPSRAQELYGGLTQCRASTHLLNVMPDGKIYPCPDLLYLPEMLQGDVVGNWLKRSSLQPHPDMPCEGCAAFAYCRRNCMKNLHLAYVRKNDAWRKHVTEPVCALIRFLGAEVDRHRPARWFAGAPLPVRKAITDAEVYEFCEVMP